MTRPPPDIEPVDLVETEPGRWSARAERQASPGERRLDWLSGFLAGVIAGMVIGWATPARSETLDARRIYVIDGDTVRLPAKGSAPAETVRLWNIDAPETARAQCEAEAALGFRAKQRLASLLREGPVTLARCEPAKPGRAPRCQDQYGRTLAALSVNGRDAGQTLIAEGLATSWPHRRDWCGLRR